MARHRAYSCPEPFFQLDIRPNKKTQIKLSMYKKNLTDVSSEENDSKLYVGSYYDGERIDNEFKVFRLNIIELSNELIKRTYHTSNWSLMYEEGFCKF